MNREALADLSGRLDELKADTGIFGDVSLKEAGNLFIRIYGYDRQQPENGGWHFFDAGKLFQSPSENNDPVTDRAMLHSMFRHRFVAHVHSPLIDGLMCSRTAKQAVKTMFGENSFFIPNVPDISLNNEIRSANKNLQAGDIETVFLENNGIIFASDSNELLKESIRKTSDRIKEKVNLLESEVLPYNQQLNNVLPVLRMLLSTERIKIIRSRNNTLIEKYSQNQIEIHKISIPLTPPIVEKCRTRYMFIEQSQTPERIIESFRYQLPNFINEYGYLPEILIIKGMGIIAFAENCIDADEKLNAFENHIKICHYAQQFGGTKYLSPEQVISIDKQRSGYVRNVVSHNECNKIAILAGDEDMVSGRLADYLGKKGYNILIAGTDANSHKTSGDNKSLIFSETDISNALSLKNMISKVISEFGGLDLLIVFSTLPDQITLEGTTGEYFESLNSRNSNGYFLCVKYSSEVMKLQNKTKPDHLSDIIRINALQPGGKFLNLADRGLTQQLATELAPFNIKVNTVCRGYNFENEIWSHPGNGIFAKQLKAGKIQSARNIEDVRKHAERMIPLKRGCRVEDIIKAIWYIIEQEYETGQEITVTGGMAITDTLHDIS